MSDFQYKEYRCEWVAEVYQVDQYDHRAFPQIPFYEKAFPTREEALADLEAVTTPHPHVPGRRVFPNATHDYYSTDVRYREVLVDDVEYIHPEPKFGRLFPKRTPEEVDNDPAYKKVKEQMKPLMESITKSAGQPVVKPEEHLQISDSGATARNALVSGFDLYHTIQQSRWNRFLFGLMNISGYFVNVMVDWDKVPDTDKQEVYNRMRFSKTGK